MPIRSIAALMRGESERLPDSDIFMRKGGLCAAFLHSPTVKEKKLEQAEEFLDRHMGLLDNRMKKGPFYILSVEGDNNFYFWPCRMPIAMMTPFDSLQYKPTALEYLCDLLGCERRQTPHIF